MIRVGIVGAGFMGSTHAAAWANVPAQIAGFFSADAGQVQALAERYRAPVYADLDRLIADVDVLDICTPTDTHHAIVLKAAAAGKHIVCEKPLARTYAEGRAMVQACQQAGVQLLVAHVVRFFPEYAQARAIVERGDIGRVAVVRLTRCSFQPGVTSNSWLLDVSRSGGVILDLMIHDFDYARWVAGEVESVFARSVRSRQPDAPGDYCLAILRHRGGALSNIEGGWAYPPPLFRTALEIAGDAGLIEHPAGSSAPLGIHLGQAQSGDGPDIAVPTSPLAEDPYTTEIRHFYDVLTRGSAPLVTAEDGLAALRIALAAMRSASTGQPVRVEEVS